MKGLSLFQVVLYVVFGFAALIGLFVFATHSNQSSSGPAAVGKVVIWGTLPKAGVKDALAAAVKIDPDLKDVSYVQKDTATFSTGLAAAIATGNGPDLVLASQEELASLMPFITPVPASTLPEKTFDGAFTTGARIFAAPGKAGYYGVPFLIDPLVLYANTPLLASAGVAKPPATWDALTGLVPAVSGLTPARQITRALIALGTYDNVHDARGILSALFLQLGVPLVTYDGTMFSVDLSGGGGSGTPPGQSVVRFYTQFADPSKVSYTWNTALPDSQQAFTAGTLALYIGYVSEASLVRAANPNITVSVSPLPQPSTQLAAGVKTAYGRIYAFMIPRGSGNASGAYHAAAALAGSAEQAAAAAATGLAPATLTALSAAPADPTSAVAYAEALYTRGWLSPTPAETDQTFSTMINNVISGKQNLATALATGGAALGAQLQK